MWTKEARDQTTNAVISGRPVPPPVTFLWVVLENGSAEVWQFVGSAVFSFSPVEFLLFSCGQSTSLLLI